MPKVLFITTNRNVAWGGSEVLWSQAAEILLGYGIEVGIVLKKWPAIPEPLINLIQKGALPFYETEGASLVNRVARKWQQMSNHYPSLDKFKPDLAVISLGSHLKTLGWPTRCIKREIPYGLIFQLVTERSMEGREPYRTEVVKAAANYFVSHQNKDWLARQVYNDLPNARVIFNPFQVSFDTPFNYPSQDNGIKMAVVARLNAFHKGLDILFEVLAQQKWKQRELTVTLAGDGPSRSYLEHLKNFYALSNVAFDGFRNDVQSLWENHHGLILPSRHEGMSLALIEAMLCGRVAVATNVGGAREIIEDNVSGFIAAAPYPDLIDEALERAWQQRHRWREIGKEAYQRIRKKIPRDPAAELADDIHDRLAPRQ